jgi:hypothetical protein
LKSPAPAIRLSSCLDPFDALIAAPANHKLIFENENVRVLDVRIPAGATVPLHTHRWPSVICELSSGDFVRRDADGKVLLDTRIEPIQATPLTVHWSPPLPLHSVENVGETEIRVLSVEIKNAA